MTNTECAPLQLTNKRDERLGKSEAFEHNRPVALGSSAFTEPRLKDGQPQVPSRFVAANYKDNDQANCDKGIDGAGFEITNFKQKNYCR